MKTKMYLRVLLAMLFVTTVFTGCNNEDDPQIEPTQYSFRVEVNNITDQGAVVKVIPDQESGAATWYCSIVKEDYFAQFADDEAYLQDDLASLDKSELETLLKSGQQEIPFSNLTASTNYVAYAYGLTADGEVTSALAKATFTTQNGDGPAPGDELTFEISITNISLTAADILITPSNNEDTYYFDVWPASEFEGLNDEEILDMIDASIIPDYLSQGPDGYSADMLEMYAPLTPGTEYTVYAVGYDIYDGITTNVNLKNFSTLEATGEAPDLTLEVRIGDADGNNTSSMIYCQAYSPQAVSGRIFAVTKEAVDDVLNQGGTLEEIMLYNGTDLSAEELAMLVVEPGWNTTYQGVPAETELMVIMKVTSEGGMSTIKSSSVTTTAAQPSDLTFTFSVTEITSNSANVAVTPSNDEDTYFFDVQEKDIIDSFEGDLQALVDALNEAYYYYGGISGMLSQGPDSYPMTGLSAQTSYYVLAFGYNGGLTTELSTYEFETEELVMSDLTFDITIDENAEPIPGGVNATITPSNSSEFYMLAFELADEIDMMSSDEEIVQYFENLYGAYMDWLTVYGEYQTLPSDFGGDLALMPGAEYYLVVFGYNSGATTPVSKVRFTAGAGPDPTGTEFSFSVSNLTATTATIDVTASQEPVIYMWDIFTEQEYNDYGGTPQVFSDYINELFEYYSQAFTPAQIIAGLGAWYSGAYYEYEELDAGTSYIPFAVCVDVQGNIIGEPVVGETFTTLASGTANVRIDRSGSDNKFYRQMQMRKSARTAVEKMQRDRNQAAVMPQNEIRGAQLTIPTGQSISNFSSFTITNSLVVPETKVENSKPQQTIGSIRAILGNKFENSRPRTERKI